MHDEKRVNDRIECEKAVWTPPPSPLTVPRTEVHVWRLSGPCPASAARLETLLSSDERTRASRFIVAEDRHRFVRTRSALRLLLGQYLDVDAADVRFRYGARGKPALLSGSTPHPLRFNVSRAGDLSLLAFAWKREVGVDITRIVAMPDAEAVAARFFAPADAEVIRALQEDIREAAFFLCWARLEALAKATGQGVVAATSASRALADDRWTVQDLRVGPDCAAALAMEGAASPVRCWNADLVVASGPS